MSSDISGQLRSLVAERAAYRCEYCLLHEDDSYSPHQVDHVIARKHGGPSTLENLAYACLRCNIWKGSDIGSADAVTGQFVSFFNPRTQEWAQHFRLQGFIIQPLAPEGRVTARVLRLNIDKRVVERRALMLVDRYPHELTVYGRTMPLGASALRIPLFPARIYKRAGQQQKSERDKRADPVKPGQHPDIDDIQLADNQSEQSKA